jgi:hypothetical protein
MRRVFKAGYLEVARKRHLKDVRRPTGRTKRLRILLEFAFNILSASLKLDKGDEVSAMLRPDPDGSWADFLAAKAYSDREREFGGGTA